MSVETSGMEVGRDLEKCFVIFREILGEVCKWAISKLELILSGKLCMDISLILRAYLLVWTIVHVVFTIHRLLVDIVCND